MTCEVAAAGWLERHTKRATEVKLLGDRVSCALVLVPSTSHSNDLVPVLGLPRRPFWCRHGGHVKRGIAPAACAVQIDSDVDFFAKKRQYLEVAALARGVRETCSGG